MLIGFPRGLFFYDHFPFWNKFIKSLGHEIIISRTTDSTLMNRGINFAVDDICLPVKVYFGHLLDLIDRNVDKVLLPRMISSEDGGYYCPKLFALADIFIAGTTHQTDFILDLEVNSKLGKGYNYNQLRLLAKKLGTKSSKKFSQAFYKATIEQQKFQQQLCNGILLEKLLADYLSNNSFSITEKDLDNSESNVLDLQFRYKKNEPQLQVGVFGHSYIVNDSFINMDLFSVLHDSGIKTVTCSNYTKPELEEALSLLSKPIFWEFGEQILGSVLRQVKYRDLDGIIIPIAFGCGPGSLILEMCEQECSENNIPLLIVTLDEHTGKNGVRTRLEAFIDMLKKRRQVV